MKENEEPDVQQKPGVQIRLRPQSIHAASLSLSSTHNISFSLFSAEPPRKSPTGAEMKNREEHEIQTRSSFSLYIYLFLSSSLSRSSFRPHRRGNLRGASVLHTCACLFGAYVSCINYIYFDIRTSDDLIFSI